MKGSIPGTNRREIKKNNKPSFGDGPAHSGKENKLDLDAKEQKPMGARHLRADCGVFSLLEKTTFNGAHESQERVK